MAGYAVNPAGQWSKKIAGAAKPAPKWKGGITYPAAKKIAGAAKPAPKWKGGITYPAANHRPTVIPARPAVLVMARPYTYKSDPKKKCDLKWYAVKYNEFCCVKNYGKGCSH